jgi:hypothetical protein
MRKTTTLIGLFGVVALLGCASTPEIEDQGRGVAGSAAPFARLGVAEPVSGAAQSARGLLEYRHTPDRSRMLTGPNAASRFEDGMQKVVGDWGTMAIDVRNGHAQGVPNADAPTLARAPFGSTLAEHNEHVKAMFVAAGVPEAEIGSVQGSVGQGYGGRAGEEAEPYGNRWYVSTLTRTAGGIPVGESFAWAQIDERDEVVSEAVYWPAIPQKVIDEAKALQAKLDAPGGRESFLSTLAIDRAEAASGRVVIRHSSAVAEGPFETHAVYDVTRRTRGGMSHTLHFDANGAEVRLPQERRAAPSAPRAAAAK